MTVDPQPRTVDNPAPAGLSFVAAQQNILDKPVTLSCWCARRLHKAIFVQGSGQKLIWITPLKQGISVA
jgi:hypothetical protein